jgi:hypothetical protein
MEIDTEVKETQEGMNIIQEESREIVDVMKLEAATTEEMKGNQSTLLLERKTIAIATVRVTAITIESKRVEVIVMNEIVLVVEDKEEARRDLPKKFKSGLLILL